MYEYRIQFSKLAQVRYLSHLELVKVFERALRRAQIPMVYSEGFHPHPKMSFGPALAVGLMSVAEYFDLDLTEEFRPETLITRLNDALPSGLEVTAACWLKNQEKPLNAWLNRAAYSVELKTDVATIDETAAAFEELPTRTAIWVSRTNKKGTKTVDIRPWLYSVNTKIIAANRLQVSFIVEIGSRGNIRPEELLDLVTHPVEVLNIVRVGLWHEQDGLVKKPLDFC
ncbi:MAG TPA: TIGR03936 family radical SAM-associated protein [Bacillota bacterium]